METLKLKLADKSILKVGDVVYTREGERGVIKEISKDLLLTTDTHYIDLAFINVLEFNVGDEVINNDYGVGEVMSIDEYRVLVRFYDWHIPNMIFAKHRLELNHPFAEDLAPIFVKI